MLDECSIFFRAVLARLQPTISAFELREVDRRAERTGCFVRMANSTTGLEISYEPFEGGLFVRVSRLTANGSFPAYPIFIDDSSNLQTFDLQDIRKVRGEPAFLDKGKDVAALGAAAATAIEESGSRFLTGDFAELQGAWEIVKARVRQFRDEQNK